MTIDTIRYETLREYREHDPSAPISSSATEVNRYLNWAYEDYVVYSKPCLNSATTTISPGDSVYDLPSDCVIPYEIYAGSVRLGCKRYYEKDDRGPEWRTDNNTTVTSYIPLGYNKIETYPKKTTAGTLSFYYYQNPASASSATDFRIREAEQRSLKGYALAIMHLQGRNWKLAQQYLDKYRNYRQSHFRHIKEERSGDLGGSIKSLSRSEWNKRRFDR